MVPLSPAGSRGNRNTFISELCTSSISKLRILYAAGIINAAMEQDKTRAGVLTFFVIK